MGCLNVKVNRKNGISVYAGRAGLFSADTRRIDGIGLSVMRIGRLSASANRINVPKVSCGLICSVRTERTLDVSPKHIFLMEANGYTDEVYIVTNAIWNLS